MFSDAPRISSKTFVNPGVPPIKPIPSIKEVVAAQHAAPATVQGTAQTAAPAEQPAETAPQPVGPAADTVAPASDEPAAVEPAPTDAPAEVDAPAAETTSAPTDFASCWHILFEELFANNHLIYYSLKDEVPRYENDTIYIEVKNNIQKEQFESRKRAIVEYWRNHFTLNVDDLEIVTNEQKEEHRVIISADDKLRNMVEQNANLPEFLNILGFRMKD